MRHRRLPLFIALSLVFVLAAACRWRQSVPAVRKPDPDVARFLESYTETYVELVEAASLAEWDLNTKIVEGDSSNKERVEAAQLALAEFTGSRDVIRKTRVFLRRRDALPEMQVRQLDAILYKAAQNPATIPEVVAKRIAAEARQTEALFGFDFQIGGTSVSTNDIDKILRTSSSEVERLAAWNASKEVGKGLKENLAVLVQLRNQSVEPLGHDDYFAYQVSEYGLKTSEMMELMHGLVRELRPLYRELHTWARYELAARYGTAVPKALPAHWLPNRWGQSWRDLVKVEGVDIDASLETKSPEWIVDQAEQFYVSLGFEKLPEVFRQESSLYPLPEDAEFKKNNHASAWHMDLDRRVRCLMSVEPNTDWFETTHHELGHIYYFLAYSRPEVPPLLREGANRGFHEAIGSLLGLASLQKSFLVGRGLIPEASTPSDNAIELLLQQALDSVVFIPFSAGTMTHFEHDLYAEDLPIDQYNVRWWKYVENFQGIAPPAERGEEYCDAASKTHINNDAAQYYDYAVSYVLLHQFHRHIAEEILGEDPRDTDYWGRRDVGEFLDGILRRGATENWRSILQDTIGEDLSAEAMLEYFEPLLAYLRERNAGREHTLAEI